MRYLVCSLIGLLAILPGLPAFAQSCFPREGLVETLERQFDERLRMQALTTAGPLLEMFVAPSGSWTIFLTRPDGVACPIAAGHGVEMIESPQGDPA